MCPSCAGLGTPAFATIALPVSVPRTCFVGPLCRKWQRGPAVLLLVARTHMYPCTCSDRYLPSHVWMSPCARGERGPGGGRSTHASWRACGCVQRTRGATCAHAQSWPLSPSWLPPSRTAADSEGGGRSGCSQPCSPGRRPGQGGRLQPGQGWAGQGWAGWVLPVQPVAAASDRRLAPVRKALPGEMGLLEAESSPPSSS